jgi:hypothetical protein
MKLKAIVGALVIGAAGAAVAFAAPPPGKGPHHGSTSTSTGTIGLAPASTGTVRAHGKPAATGENCKPAIMVVVKGKANADAGGNALSLNVTGGNKFAKLLFGGGVTALTVNTTAKTQISAGGNAHALTSVKKGDNVLAQYRVCKADVTGKSGHVANAGALSTFLTSLSPRKVVDLGQENDDNEND